MAIQSLTKPMTPARHRFVEVDLAQMVRLLRLVGFALAFALVLVNCAGPVAGHFWEPGA